MESLGQRLRFARSLAKLTQQQVADHFGIKRVNVTQWEADTTRPDVARIPELATLLSTSEAWLLSEKGEPPTEVAITPAGNRRAMPVVKAIPGAQLLAHGKMPIFAAAMGGDGHVIVSFDAIDEVKRPAELENVRNGYGLLIVGESMVPAFWPGDMALVNPNLPPARLRNVILYHTPPNGGEVEAMVKQLNSWTDREWLLQQYNPLLEFREFRQEWPICHRVVGKYDAR